MWVDEMKTESKIGLEFLSMSSRTYKSTSVDSVRDTENFSPALEESHL